MARTGTDSLVNILPHNSTKLERDVLRVAPFDNVLEPAFVAITGGRGNLVGTPRHAFGSEFVAPANDYTLTDLLGNVAPWLCIEYGVDQFAEFLPDPIERLAKGLTLQGLIGTPAGMALAMELLGLAVTIVEEDAPTIHFPEYQIRLDAIPVDTLAGIQRILRLARIMQPVRSRLRRLICGWDQPRLLLDNSPFGSLLSDYSGLYLDKVMPPAPGQRTDLRISFARHRATCCSGVVVLAAHEYHKDNLHQTRILPKGWPLMDGDYLRNFYDPADTASGGYKSRVDFLFAEDSNGEVIVDNLGVPIATT